MAAISAAMVKELREKTGAGMMQCKEALNETNGDMEAAIDWLRTKGLAKAAKKAGRVAADGLIGVAVSGNKGAVVEVNSETDFVARNESFQSMVTEIAKVALDQGGDLDALKAASFPGTEESVEGHVTTMVATIGENMTLRRSAGIAVEEGIVASYMHSQIAPSLGKIGVLVGLASTGKPEALEALGKQIAMHIAAANPLALTKEDLDPAVIERERAVFAEQARESGKPDNIIEKMVEGRIRKYYEEVVLLSQVFVVDGENRIEAVLKNAEKDAGAPVEIKGFVRFAIGEGIEKEETDFAAEVSAAVGNS